jgi:hypothetical protein
MGHGYWENSTYAAAASTRRLTGVSDFDYSDRVRASGKYEVHEDLDPKKVAGQGSPHAGQVMRECRDSVDHPLTVPITVFFDVTGSMTSYPRLIQERLPDLLTHLLDRIPDPSLLVGAVGDAISDRVPLQIGQFEADNRIDDQLRSIILEGGGGGGNHESYELAFYFLAHHTSTDAFEVRGRKGYAFLIGDERAYDKVSAAQVQKVLGSGTQADLSINDVVAEAQQKFEVFFISVNNSYRSQNEQYWKGLVGDDQYLTLDNPDDLVELIGDTVVAGETAHVVASPLGTTSKATTTP